MGNKSNSSNRVIENNERFRKLLQTTEYENIPPKAKAAFDDVFEWADNNGLEIENISSSKTFSNTPSRIRLLDPETGKKIAFSDKALYDLYVHDEIYDEPIQTRLNKLITDLHDINPEYKGFQQTNKINIIQDENIYGRFKHNQPHNIILSTEIFHGVNMENAWDTGLKGTLYHEMAHLYDFNKHGETGIDGVFSNSRPYQPTDYGDLYSWEVMSTMVEQVGTGKLRPDAMLRDGSRPNSYQEWYDDWNKTELIRETEKIINGLD